MLYELLWHCLIAKLETTPFRPSTNLWNSKNAKITEIKFLDTPAHTICIIFLVRV